MGSLLTPLRKIPYPAETDVPDVAADLNALANNIDNRPIVGQGTLASRPASAVAGNRFYVSGDGTTANNGIEWVDTGVGWVAVNSFPQGLSAAGLAALNAGRSEPSVTALPTLPVDGQFCNLLVDSTNGVVWTFRYRAASASTFKWEFVGGSPLYAEVQTGEATGSGAYAALTTAGPSITLPTLPSGGDFDVTIGALISTNTTAGKTAQTLMSFDIGGTAAVDADSVQSFADAATTANAESVSRTRRKAALSSAVALVAKYKTVVSGGTPTSTFANRFMRVTPVRVG